MKNTRMPVKTVVAVLALGVVFTAGCSGSREDVRVTLCKNLTTALSGTSGELEWTGGENTFNRPAYAITSLTFNRAGGDAGTGKSACYFAYDAVEETAQMLADPLSAYATLPFRMDFDGHTLGDGELLRLVNAEQVRLGRKAVDTLRKGAEDMADKVRAGIGQ